MVPGKLPQSPCQTQTIETSGVSLFAPSSALRRHSEVAQRRIQFVLTVADRQVHYARAPSVDSKTMSSVLARLKFTVHRVFMVQ